MFVRRLNAIFLVIVIPLVLLSCFLFRINIQSLIYMIFLFVLPSILPINNETIKTRIRNYLISLIIISGLLIIGQLIFQIVLLANKPYGSIISNCSFNQELLDIFGFYKFDRSNAIDIVRIILPDVFVCVASIVSFVICLKAGKLPQQVLQQLTISTRNLDTATTTSSPQTATTALTSAQQLQQRQHSQSQQPQLQTLQSTTTGTADTLIKKKHVVKLSRNRLLLKRLKHWILPIVCQLVFLILLAVAGGLLPSVLSIPYFLLFVIIITYWSCAPSPPTVPPAAAAVDQQHQVSPQSETPQQQQQQTLNSVQSQQSATQKSNYAEKTMKLVLLFYMSLHLILIYLFQFEFLQSHLKDYDLLTRLLGLYPYISTKCADPTKLKFNSDLSAEQIVYPFVLMLFYWLLALELSYFDLIRKNANKKRVLFGRRIIKSKDGESTAAERQIKTTTSINNNNNNNNITIIDGTTNNTCNVAAATTATTSSGAASNDENLRKRKLSFCTTNNNDTTSSNNDNNNNNKAGSSYKRLFNDDEITEEQQRRAAARTLSVVSESHQQSQSNLYMENIRTMFNAFIRYLHKQSYLLCLITMMAWSITYHSILTFILLIWACLIWVLPKSRGKCLNMSPFFVFYGVCLLFLQFIYGLDLKPNELSEYKEIGLVRYKVPSLHLLIKIGYLLPFWLTLQQWFTERRRKQSLLRNNGDTAEVTASSQGSLEASQFVGVRFIYRQLIRYWIFISSGMLLLMSCQNEVVAYRIVYMILFLYFATTFQFFYNFWRSSIYVFHFIVVVYSMAVLLLLYVFQFNEVPNYVKKYLKLNDNELKSIGFEKFEQTDQLVVRLLTPTTFLIVNILQINYFNAPWLQLTKKTPLTEEERRQHSLFVIENEQQEENAPTTTTAPAQAVITDDDENNENEQRLRDRLVACIKKLINLIQEKKERFIFYAWRLAEIHIYKIVLMVIAGLCLSKVNLIDSFIFLLLIASMLLDRIRQIEYRIQKIFRVFVQLFMCLLIIISMIFQLSFISKTILQTNCSTAATNVTVTGRLIGMDPYLNRTQDNLEYIGIQKTNNIGYYLQNYIIIVLMLTVQSIIRARMDYFRVTYSLKLKPYNIIYNNITSKHLDKGILFYIKYLINFLFFKFGLEICFIMSIMTIGVRMDAYAIVYGLWLGIFLTLKRVTISKIWPVYFIFLAILLPIQYFCSLGLPPVFCFTYPWTSSAIKFQKLRVWLFLADYSDPPNATVLAADFFQLLFVWLQMSVFRHESQNTQLSNLAGSNHEIIYDEEPYKDNPYYDFISKFRTYLDHIKFVVYMYSYWVVLAIVFLAGTSRISILCMGYVILCFFFLWYGQNFLIKPIQRLVKMWNIIIFYCFLVIFIKASMQVLFCVFSTDIKANIVCIIVDIIGINCRLNLKLYQDSNADTGLCDKDADNAGLVWDCFCFAILIFQKRLYMSRMFEHVVNELKIQSRLAARGADIFNAIISEKIIKDRSREERILQKVRNNLERIRQYQLENNKDIKEPKDHYEAIRSGNADMFDDKFDLDNDEVLETEPDQPPADTPVVDQQDGKDTVDGQKKSKMSMEDVTLKEVAETTEATETEQVEAKPSEKDSEEITGRKVFDTLKRYLIKALEHIVKILNDYSSDFRLVSKKLAKEKYALKIKDSSNQEASDTSIVASTNVSVNASNKAYMDEVDAEFDLSDKPLAYRLVNAVYYFVLSQSELLCYFLMILTHLLSASILSIPLPLSVFLWGLLCIPRPSKIYWITCITYTESVVVIKYLFQFQLFPWNDTKKSNLFDAALKQTIPILGIDKKNDNFATVDLFLLLSLFLHRSILKRLGLWNDARYDEGQNVTCDVTNTSNNNINNNNNSKSDEVSSKNIVVTVETEENLNIQETNDDDELVEEEEEEVVVEMDADGNILVKSDENDPDKPPQQSLTQKTGLNPFWKFYKNSNERNDIVVADYYAWIFLCDFINCVTIIFSYQYFGETANIASTNSNVVSSIQDNKVPYTFLIMLLVQFLLMIIDRALYLRKNVRGKFIFQLLQVVFVHVWMFFALPYVTKLNFINNPAAQFWYFVKCVYFGFSSKQICCGYPTRILGNFLTKSYNYVNLVLFKGFLLVPFLLELRALMDWMFTDTSLSLGDWLQMEDIYANIFVLKCFRWGEKKYPTPRGTKRRAIVKYGFGGFLLSVIILIIWFPLLLFSFSEGFNRSVPPSSATVEIQIGGYLPIYRMTALERYLKPFTKDDFDKLKKNAPETAFSFLKDFTVEDVYCIQIPGDSTSTWQISPPTFEIMKDDLNSSSEVKLDYTYTLTRVSSEQKNEVLSEIVSANRQISLDNETKDALYDVLTEGEKTNSAIIKTLYPKYVRARAKGNIVEIEEMKTIDSGYYSSVNVSLKNQSNQLWWDVYSIPNTTATYELPCSQKMSLSFIVFSDKVSPSSISFITNYGIFGLYSTFIIFVSQMLREFFVNTQSKIMFEELPNVDRLWVLIKLIFLCREALELLLESELYDILVYVHRDPALLIEFTREKDEEKPKEEEKKDDEEIMDENDESNENADETVTTNNDKADSDNKEEP